MTHPVRNADSVAIAQNEAASGVATSRCDGTPKPRLLDGCCCEGGAGTGYARAGFAVFGVDSDPDALTRYPFPSIECDALEFIAEHGHEFDAIHVSPPCQARTTMSNRWRGKGGVADEHVNLIGPTRDLLIASGKPWVLENVVGARRDLPNAFILHGGMFGLRVDRPRLFESNVLILTPAGAGRAVDPIGVYGKHHDGRLLFRRADGTEQRAASSLEEAREAMGMPWASWRGCAEAIPPAYTEFIGQQLLRAVEVAA